MPYTITEQKGFFKSHKVALAVMPQALTTASGAINGEDFSVVGAVDKFESALLVFAGRVTLSKAKKVTYSLALQHGDTSTAYTATPWADGSTVQVLTIGTTGSTATQTNLKGSISAGARLGKLKGHIRVVCTCSIPISTFASSGTIGGNWVLGGASNVPPA